MYVEEHTPQVQTTGMKNAAEMGNGIKGIDHADERRRLMEKITLLSLTTKLLDLEAERKAFNKEIGEKIKDLRESIKMNVRDTHQGKLPLEKEA